MTGVGAGDFRVGDVLLRGLSILAHNFVPFGLLALAFTAPPFIYALATAPTLAPDAAPELTVSTGDVAIFAANILLRYVLIAALVYGTIRELRASRASLRECVSRGLGLVFPVVGVAILVAVATGLAAMLLIVPGLIVAAMLWVAVPIAVVERPGVINSLTRSAELTKGYRWPVFGIIAIVVGANFMLVLLAGAAVSAIGGETASLVLSWILSAVFGAVIAVVSAVSYHDLRIAKEGVDVHQIARVFD